MDNKKQGEMVEAEFQFLALRLGIIVCKPYGDSTAYDFIIDANGLKRIQIKSTSSKKKNRNSYGLKICKSKDEPYSSKDTDFVIIKVIPTNTWYIVPINAITNIKMNLAPDIIDSNSKYEKYKENWQLLFS